jgi:hypothetical protein
MIVGLGFRIKVKGFSVCGAGIRVEALALRV